MKYTTAKMTIAIESGNQIGANTHHQLQEITPVSLSTMNATHKISKKPSVVFINTSF